MWKKGVLGGYGGSGVHRAVCSMLLRGEFGNADIIMGMGCFKGIESTWVTGF
jgi:hypothetical protein